MGIIENAKITMINRAFNQALDYILSNPEKNLPKVIRW